MRRDICDLYDAGDKKGMKNAFDQYVKVSQIIWNGEISQESFKSLSDPVPQDTLDSEVLDCMESGRRILTYRGLDWCLLSRIPKYCPHQQEVLDEEGRKNKPLYYCSRNKAYPETKNGM